jgi:hypothetical protein
MKIPTNWLAALGIALGAAISISSPTWAEDEMGKAAENKSMRTCFWLHSINDFRAIDNYHVWVRGVSRKEQYLLTLFQYCNGVRFTEHIALQTHPTNRLCSNGNEHLIMLDHNYNRRCLISNIEPVGDIKEARELVNARKEAKEEREDEAKLDKLEKLEVAMDEGAQ